MCYWSGIFMTNLGCLSQQTKPLESFSSHFSILNCCLLPPIQRSWTVWSWPDAWLLVTKSFPPFLIKSTCRTKKKKEIKNSCKLLVFGCLYTKKWGWSKTFHVSRDSNQRPLKYWCNAHQPNYQTTNGRTARLIKWVNQCQRMFPHFT